MSKLKTSFSLIIMLLLVGMFSAVAFAAEGPGGISVKQNADNSLTVNWSAVTAPANQAYTGITYTLTVKDPSDATVYTTAVPTSGLTDTTTVLDPTKRYSMTLTFNATDYKGQPISGSNTIDYSMTDYNSTLATGDSADNNLANANHTGSTASDNTGSLAGHDGVVKARMDQKVHGSYQNNTNSCASCHQTHTGNDGSLLFKDGTYNTCSACHDGTLGFYNVFSASNAGTFNGTHDGNMSVHLSDGAVAITAAPGGLQGQTSGTWAGEFTCASCHNPHGSDSIRLLSTNPGGVQSKSGNVVDAASIPTPATDTYLWVKDVVGSATAPSANYNGLADGTKVIQLYKNVSGTYTADFALATKETVSQANWLYKADGTSMLRAGADIAYYTSATNVYAYIPTGGTASKAYDLAAKSSFTVPIIVKGKTLDAMASNGIHYTTVDNRAYFDSTDTNFTVGNGASMSQFCTACHVDYLSTSHSNVSGTYTQAYRHQTSTDKLTCVRCHFAHGTDATIMKDSLDRDITKLIAVGAPFDPANYAGDTTAATAAATDYLKDPNPSSALKRYTGMAACYGCHDYSIDNDATSWSTASLGQTGVQ